MLTIYVKNMVNVTEFTWKVGQPIPKIADAFGNVDAICTIRADGKELKHILKRFTNKTILRAPKGVADPPSVSVESVTIPVPQGKVASWYGDLAKTIFLNL